MNVLITGVSSGLGKALKEEYLDLGHNVYGISRGKVDNCNHSELDLSYIPNVNQKLPDLLEGVKELDVVILNAGMLGNIKTFDKWKHGELLEMMNVNVWSNKYILDWLFENDIKVKQVITISSGASEHTYKGWGGYSITKSALRMMTEVYSKEVEDTHFLSLAPGLVDTSMQEYLCNDVDVDEFPLTEKFIKSREDGTTKSPEEVSKKIIDLMTKFKKLETGSFDR
jgi:benzil reductase ((S)-benzoin forming)